MQEAHLAIATVPVQNWGPIYEDGEALQIGTIFKELDKPFFASVPISEKNTGEVKPKDAGEQEKEALLRKIFEVSFVLDDLVLYLDTHEHDKEALQLFCQKGSERDKLKREFAEKFYPLTRDCLVYCKEKTEFCWQDGPVPWEGVCI